LNNPRTAYHPRPIEPELETYPEAEVERPVEGQVAVIGVEDEKIGREDEEIGREDEEIGREDEEIGREAGATSGRACARLGTCGGGCGFGC
jgi:hypothetical protein